MKILKADVLGFCMGVRRAVSKALEEANKANGSRVITLGSLVHNPRVLEDLKINGVETLSEVPQDLNGCTFIIRAHGISPEHEFLLKEKGAVLVDATCPKVKKSQLKAQELAKTGYGIFLAGEKHHAEIEGILGYAKTAPFCTVVGNADEAKEAAGAVDKNFKTALIGQTTISEEEYEQIADTIKGYFPNLEVIDTICSATTERQQALRKLLDNPEIEAVIIAGGKESANTKRLLAIAQKSEKPCCLAESAEEIPEEFFKFDTIGLSAGASTPDCVIEEIVRRLTDFHGLKYSEI